MNPLRMVSDALAPEAPYPPEARAKGWRFALDYERIQQSDTWALAPAEVRPWLLMVWVVAWQQSPCGSLPASDELIAARIGMPAMQFAAWRSFLMRGWTLHSDGRLYHPVITEQVTEMLMRRRNESKRVRDWRLKKQALAADVTRNTAVVTTPEPEPSSSSPSEKKARAPRSPGLAGENHPIPGWLPKEAWLDWCQHRVLKSKKDWTEGAMQKTVKALAKYRDAGIDPVDCIDHSIASGYQGLYAPPRQAGARSAPSPRPSRAEAYRDLLNGQMARYGLGPQAGAIEPPPGRAVPLQTRPALPFNDEETIDG